MPTIMTAGNTAAVHGGDESDGRPENWEMRPCGMLVQKRLDADESTAKPPPTIRVRVKFGSISHEIHINSQASFGELKKMLTGPTGLHHEDQKLFYKGKERDSKQFLDIVGVKDKSKVVLMEDPISQEKRYLEMRKNARMEKAARSISDISLEVDRLAGQVTALESVVLKGGRVAEKQIVDVIELLMNQLVKLDGIQADGDVKLQRKMQVRRVQKLIETLDMLKIKNSTPSPNTGDTPKQNDHKIPNVHSVNGRVSSRNSTSSTVVTTQWETFESGPPLIPTSWRRSGNPNQVKTPWDIFQ